VEMKIKLRVSFSAPSKQANSTREVRVPCTRVASAARAASLCAGHAQQLGGESPLPNLMEVKG